MLYSYEINGVIRVVDLDVVSDNAILSNIFNEVIATRVILFLLGFLFYITLIAFYDSNLIGLAILWAIVPLGYALQPSWFFQGMCDNVPIAVSTFLSRGLAVISVYLYLEAPSDYYLVPGFIGIFFLGGAIISYLYAIKKYKIKVVKVAFKSIKNSLVSGRFIFVGNLSVGMYREANILILAIVGVEEQAVAAYSIAEKVIKAFQASIRPLNQLAFPYVIKIAQEHSIPSRMSFLSISKMVLPQLILLVGLGAIIAFVVAAWPLANVWFESLNNKELIYNLIFVLLAGAFFGVANFMYGSAGLNAFGLGSYLSRAILATGFVSLMLNYIFISTFGVLGASMGFAFAELLLLILIVKKYFKY